MSTTISADSWQAKQIARAAVREVIARAFPHLKRSDPDDGRSSLTAAAKNMRFELKQAFPGIKFKVATRRFSMGNAIDVDWKDGPTSKQVEPIINKYEAGSFDGMTDCYNYEPSTYRDAFGSAKYVQAHRHYSAAMAQRAIDAVWEQYRPVTPKPDACIYFAGFLISAPLGCEDCAQTVINRYLSRFDATTNTLDEGV